MRSFCEPQKARQDWQVREEFLGFVQADISKGQALAKRFLGTQQDYGLHVNHIGI